MQISFPIVSVSAILTSHSSDLLNLLPWEMSYKPFFFFFLNTSIYYGGIFLKRLRKLEIQRWIRSFTNSCNSSISLCFDIKISLIRRNWTLYYSDGIFKEGFIKRCSGNRLSKPPLCEHCVRKHWSSNYQVEHFFFIL